MIWVAASSQQDTFSRNRQRQIGRKLDGIIRIWQVINSPTQNVVFIYKRGEHQGRQIHHDDFIIRINIFERRVNCDDTLPRTLLIRNAD